MCLKGLFTYLCVLFIVMELSACTTIQSADSDFLGSFGGEIRDGVASHNFIFLAQGNAIVILDAKDKNHLHEIGRYRSERDSVDALAVKWPILFFSATKIGDSGSEVASLNVKDPAQPHEIPVSEELEGNIFDLATSGSLLLTNMHGARLQIYEISDPYHPKAIEPKIAYEKWEWGTDIDMIRQLKPPLNIPEDVLYSGSVSGVAAEGQFVYILDDKGNLKAFDLTDPLKPRRNNSITNTDQIKSRIKSEIRAFNNEDKIYRDHFRIVRDDSRASDQITIQDIANKNAPQRVSAITEEANYRRTIEKFGIVGDFLVVVYFEDIPHGCYSISIYDIKDPENPFCVGDYYNKLWQIPDNVAIAGDRIYVADQERGLIILCFMKSGNHAH